MNLNKQKSSRNQMKTQKSVIFFKKNLKIYMLKTKNILKLEIIAIIQGNVEVLGISCIILKIVYLKKFL